MFIHLENVSYTYNLNMPFETEAIRSINIQIKKGEFVGIIGHTGCGKTTLLQLISGLLEPTEGRVLIDGVDIHKEKAKLRDVRKKIGLTFQYPENQLFEESIFKEIAFGPKNLGMIDDLIEEKVKKALEMVEMNYQIYKDRSPFSLSGGEMRKIAIASVLAIDPEVIILDEPTASLDPQNRTSLLKLITNLHRRHKKTVILVSHNMEVIAQLAQRIIVMEQGKVVIDATPRDIFQNYVAQIEKIGLALPQITCIMHRLKQMGKPVNTGILTIEEAQKEILKLTKMSRGVK